MRKFDELNKVEQQDIEKKFILPNETTYVEVNENNVPFYRISGALVACTVKNNNFHVYSNKQKQ